MKLNNGNHLQSKCTEMILELNHCLEEILRANSGVKTAADLSTKYRKNVQYNLEATIKAVATSEVRRSEEQVEGSGTA